MARPRSFDETDLLESVMVAFWRDGYAATTYRSLESQSGVGIRSLANTFGDKDELYTRALNRYRHMVESNLDAMFDPPSVESIVVVFERVSSPAEPSHPRRSGCLMVNTVFEFDDPGKSITAEVDQYRALWHSKFQSALEADQVDCAETRADFLVGALWGALSQVRMASDPTAAKAMTSVIVETVRNWAHTA